MALIFCGSSAAMERVVASTRTETRAPGFKASAATTCEAIRPRGLIEATATAAHKAGLRLLVIRVPSDEAMRNLGAAKKKPA